jgi:hypothetical protein
MRPALLIAAVVVLLAVAAAFARHQTALPDYDRAVIHVKLHRSGLDELASSLLAEPEISWVAYSDNGGVIAGSPSELRVALDQASRDRYERLFSRAGLYFITKSQGYAEHALIELGSGTRFRRDFGVGLLYGPGPDSDRCSEQYRHAAAGQCHFNLGGSWYLHYGWTTAEPITAQQGVEPDVE